MSIGVVLCRNLSLKQSKSFASGLNGLQLCRQPLLQSDDTIGSDIMLTRQCPQLEQALLNLVKPRWFIFDRTRRRVQFIFGIARLNNGAVQ